MMRTHSMTDISDRVARLKQDFLNPDTPNEKKAKRLLESNPQTE